MSLLQRGNVLFLMRSPPWKENATTPGKAIDQPEMEKSNQPGWGAFLYFF